MNNTWNKIIKQLESNKNSILHNKIKIFPQTPSSMHSAFISNEREISNESIDISTIIGIKNEDFQDQNWFYAIKNLKDPENLNCIRLEDHDCSYLEYYKSYKKRKESYKSDSLEVYIINKEAYIEKGYDRIRILKLLFELKLIEDNEFIFDRVTYVTLDYDRYKEYEKSLELLTSQYNIITENIQIDIEKQEVINYILKVKNWQDRRYKDYRDFQNALEKEIQRIKKEKRLNLFFIKAKNFFSF